MKKVVVFGGAGFMGGYTVRRLQREKIYDVYSYDCSPSTDVDKSRRIVSSILNKEDVRNAIKGASVVFNYAAIADIEDCIESPIEAVKTNILGNAIILDECAKLKIERYIFASSVYAESDLGGVYRTTKLSCESLIRDYHKYHDLNYTILRYGTLYGPGATLKNSVHRFLRQALTTGIIEYHGTGKEKREYIHASDAAELTLLALEKKYENRCLILTGERVLKSSDLFSIIKEILNNDMTVEYDYAETKGLIKSHYQTTPYSYTQTIPKKLMGSEYIDIGLGLIDCLKDIDRGEK
jgi:UDP-glucose 4-epimerase